MGELVLARSDYSDGKVECFDDIRMFWRKNIENNRMEKVTEPVIEHLREQKRNRKI